MLDQHQVREANKLLDRAATLETRWAEFARDCLPCFVNKHHQKPQMLSRYDFGEKERDALTQAMLEGARGWFRAELEKINVSLKRLGVAPRDVDLSPAPDPVPEECEAE